MALPENFNFSVNIARKQLPESEQQKLKTAFEAFVPDDYQSRLPQWMQQNARAGLRCTMDAKTAHYLQQVAWDECQLVNTRFRRPTN